MRKLYAKPSLVVAENTLDFITMSGEIAGEYTAQDLGWKDNPFGSAN